MEGNMQAKPLVPNKFWIVQDNGKKIGTLQKDTNCYYFVTKMEKIRFDTKEDIYSTFGNDFFEEIVKAKTKNQKVLEVYEYPTSTTPYNPLYDVKNALPLYSKSRKSKSLYCAGYYCIKFAKGWVKSFCPKLITLQRYGYKGPFKTEFEMKQVLSNVSKTS